MYALCVRRDLRFTSHTYMIQSSPYFDPTHTRTGWIGQPPILDRLEVVTDYVCMYACADSHEQPSVDGSFMVPASPAQRDPRRPGFAQKELEPRGGVSAAELPNVKEGVHVALVHAVPGREIAHHALFEHIFEPRHAATFEASKKRNCASRSPAESPFSLTVHFAAPVSNSKESPSPLRPVGRRTAAWTI